MRKLTAALAATLTALVLAGCAGNADPGRPGSVDGPGLPPASPTATR